MPKSSAFALRRLVLPVFLPSLLLSVGEGALIPIVPAAAERLGADLPTAGLLAGLFMLGTLLADLPAAHLVVRFGERKTMVFTALLAAAGISLAYLSDTIAALGAATLIAGASQSVFGLARHGFMAHNVPQSHRARGLALLGGMFRGGSFLGPAMAAFVIWRFDVRTVFLLSVVFCLLAALVLATVARGGFEDDKPEPAMGILGVAKAERHKLATLGVASAILATVRTTRQIGLPLWALAIHLDAASTALFIAIGGAVDFALFYLSGQVMDRFGRRAAAVPTLILTGIAHLFVFLVVDATGFLWLSIGMALANGIGSGVIMVLGADLAPPKSRNQFLASFRLIIDAAQAATPPVLAAGAAVIGLGTSMTGFGLLAFGGAWLMYRYIPRFTRH